jgi:F-type H+-transporting ATPase subunit delta
MASSKYIVHEIYSDVLFQLAEESGQAERAMEDLAAVGQVLRDEPDFIKLLASDRLKDAEKADVVHRVFSGRVCELTLNFLCVLARRGRMGFLSGIADRYEVLVDRLKNCRLVEITLVKKKDDAELESLRQQIKDAIGAEVKLKVNIDPAILGGIIIRQGDLMIDNSARTILARTVNAIVERSAQQSRKQEVGKEIKP